MMRALGKRPAVRDHRMALLHDVAPDIPIAPIDWRPGMPDGGLPMLGNDVHSCCVWAAIMHLLQFAANYTGIPLPSTPTTAECLQNYASTGFREAIPETDQGTVVMGPGGAIQYWSTNGVICGGQTNVLSGAAAIDHASVERLQQALMLGPVLCGAQLTQGDVEADFMWGVPGPSVGGHELVVMGWEPQANAGPMFFVATWDGERRFCSDTFKLDEAVTVLDRSWFNAANLDPSGVDWSAVERAQVALRV